MQEYPTLRPTPEPWTHAHLAELAAAIAAGQQRVRFADGREVEYRSTKELLALHSRIARELGVPTTPGVARAAFDAVFKSPQRSKTIGLGSVLILLDGAALWLEPLRPFVPQVPGILAGIGSLVIALRLVTKQPVRVRRPVDNLE